MRFAEFFAGGGMVRQGLGQNWQCVLANDIDPKKCETYRRNWGDGHLVEADIADLDVKQLLQPIDLYWASSPCQDFSLAGKGEGLTGARSGVFVTWIEKISEAKTKGYCPRIIAFENVGGLVTSNNGRDFEYVVSSLQGLGYRVGALEIDAKYFLPQSRPRIFVVCVRNDVAIDADLLSETATSKFHSGRLLRSVGNFDKQLASNWVWWKLDEPEKCAHSLADMIDIKHNSGWFEDDKTQFLLSIMSEANLAKVEERRDGSALHIGMVYKRGRKNAEGQVRQRAEVRFDGVAGCLRTPGGGSSRQTVLVVGQGQVRARLLSVREAMRLMGLPDSYCVPENYNQGYKLAGDGVAVPIVSYLRDKLFEPLLASQAEQAAA